MGSIPNTPTLKSGRVEVHVARARPAPFLEIIVLLLGAKAKPLRSSYNEYHRLYLEMVRGEIPGTPTNVSFLII